MSVKAMTWAWEQDLKPGPKFVLVALADHSDGSGICWPGHELIAEKCGLSRQTVVEHIALLERLGFVRAERTRDARGHEGRARYYLKLDRPSTRPPESEVPTLARVGISEKPESGFPSPYKEEPKAIEPNPIAPCLFSLEKAAIEAWFETAFWPRYPKRVRRGKALQVLIDAKPDQATLDTIASGLEHRLKAEEFARSRREWFRAWPDPHRWLRPSEQQWRDRFDVPRETSRDESRCWQCQAAAVGVAKGKPHCRDHNPLFEATGASA